MSSFSASSPSSPPLHAVSDDVMRELEHIGDDADDFEGEKTTVDPHPPADMTSEEEGADDTDEGGTPPA